MSDFKEVNKGLLLFCGVLLCGILLALCVQQLALLFQQESVNCVGDYLLDNATICHRGLLGLFNGDPEGFMKGKELADFVPDFITILVIAAVAVPVYAKYKKDKKAVKK